MQALLFDVHRRCSSCTRRCSTASALSAGTAPAAPPPVALLELTLHSPAFTWLRPFSRLVVNIDAALAPKHAPIEGPIASRLFDSALRLVPPGEAVASRYVEVMSEDPDLILLHARVVQAVRDARTEGLGEA